MATAPPIARDRLIGLAGVSRNLVESMETKERIPPGMESKKADAELRKIGGVIEKLIDKDLFPWLGGKLHKIEPNELAGVPADCIVARIPDLDRLCLRTAQLRFPNL